MAKFSLRINVEPQDIPKLDDAHKRDCADAINGAINRTFKYTMIFAAGVGAYFAAYSMFGLTYLLKTQEKLPQINVFIPLTAVAILIFEFISGTMKKWAIVLETLLHIVMAVLSATQYQTMIIFPFAVYGAYLHVTLFSMMPHFKVISELKGYPDFTPLPIGDVIKKKGNEAENSEENGNISEKAEKSEIDEKNGNAEAKTAEMPISEKVPETSESPSETQSETVPREISKKQGNSRKKKRKKKK